MEKKYSQINELLKTIIQDTVEEIIEQKNKIKQTTDIKAKNILDDTLNIDEAAKLLRIAKQTLYTLTSKRKIPFYKNGKKIIFNRCELEAWLIKSEQKDLTETELSSFSKSKNI